MVQPLSRILRKWFAWLMAGVLVASLVTWFFLRDTLPPVIRIGTAMEGGLYFEEGERVADEMRKRTSHEIQVIPTSGSLDNRARLRDGEIDVAIVQAGSVSLEGLAIVTPLHRDVVHLIVRRELLLTPDEELHVDSVRDLAGKTIIIGVAGSGIQKSALDVLEHYDLTQRADLREVHFTELLRDVSSEYDAAIVTSGLENEDLRKVLATGEFDLLPLDAEALNMRFRHFETYEIPKNLWPPVPRQTVPTVTASAWVVVNEDASSALVKLLLNSIFEEGLLTHFSTLFSPQQARELSPAQLHPVTRRYHDPFGQYGVLHSVLEGLAAGKELLFACGAAIYLIWDRWRRLKEKESQEQIRLQKERLDSYLERTLDIERQQMHVTDPDKLQKFLDDVTEIKLQALGNLTHEDLRGDRTFSIFLMQCANLISKIQMRIINYTRNL
ncbi:TAXI family TRAP transporter solute-binding subunit [Bythopirellula goksoeyrii]|uniref:NMT1/THI5 like protein n=1 Tax=Bythopirellula goksoeyrii TaxID=1400387 RepID=A0A5B9QJD4_9BACT|nr:TAXI family TRAP transporter solute-binding subunit [Bythopirellula goksoeyrii]QEG37690.1 hypothetical protein Pr1d_50360 [Bythopirellula goksoeyrii]